MATMLQVAVPGAAEPAKRIIIGEGAAGIRLGMTADEVAARLGVPERTNRDGERVVFMSFNAKDIFGVYFSGAPARVRMIILSVPDYCTLRGICLGKAGEIARLEKTYPGRVVRFKDWDGSITYRLLNRFPGGPSVLTEFQPGSDPTSIVQVTLMHWSGAITDSALDGDGGSPKGKGARK